MKFKLTSLKASSAQSIAYAVVLIATFAVIIGLFILTLDFHINLIHALLSTPSGDQTQQLSTPDPADLKIVLKKLGIEATQ